MTLSPSLVRIDAIELHVGEPDIPYQAIREFEAMSEARASAARTS